jgi:hypothetical protein
MAPARIRGALNIMFQLAVTIGILIAQLINYGAQYIDPWGWRLSLGKQTYTSFISYFPDNRQIFKGSSWGLVLIFVLCLLGCSWSLSGDPCLVCLLGKPDLSFQDTRSWKTSIGACLFIWRHSELDLLSAFLK